MNQQLKAAQTFWAAKRDEAAANLDGLLNKPVTIANPQELINRYMRDFSEATSVLTTIGLIIQQAEAQNQTPPTPAPTSQNPQ